MVHQKVNSYSNSFLGNSWLERKIERVKKWKKKKEKGKGYQLLKNIGNFLPRTTTTKLVAFMDTEKKKKKKKKKKKNISLFLAHLLVNF